MYKGHQIWSPSGLSNALFQHDGNFVVMLNSKIVFQTFTEGVGEYVSMQTDGNLVVYDNLNMPVWATNTYNNSIIHAYIQDDGNLILEDSQLTPKWATRYSFILKSQG